MSLPWFPYHIDKFLSDTLALDGVAVGAYHLLMLHYYATETPPRDNDRVLATIARLPIDLWMERRPEIEVFFQIRDGAWHHATIEAEMLEASTKHAAGIARAKAGAAAMHAKKGHKPATGTAQAMPAATSKQVRRALDALSSAASKPQAVPEQCLKDAHSTLTEESLSLVLDVTVEKDNNGDNLVDWQQQADQEEWIGALIDPAFRPAEGHLETCRADGASPAQIEHEIAVFIATKQDAGSFSHDWQAAWWKWWLRWRERRAKQESVKPKPRIEVSNTIDWDAHAKRWASGMGWPRGVGADPTSPACRCPPEVLERHGIDPSTGEKIKSTEKV